MPGGGEDGEGGEWVQVGGQVKLGQPRQVFAWHNLYLTKRQIKLAKHLTFMLRGWKSCSSREWERGRGRGAGET